MKNSFEINLKQKHSLTVVVTSVSQQYNVFSNNSIIFTLPACNMKYLTRIQSSYPQKKNVLENCLGRQTRTLFSLAILIAKNAAQNLLKL